MKALLVVLLLLVVGAVGLAFYEGWIRLSTDQSHPTPSATITVDEDKIQADKKKIEALGEKAKEKAADPTQNVQPPKNAP